MKKGFTLAEVLITLGIIGVVAAMTLPTLVHNYKKQEVSAKLKKFYSTMSQAVKLSELDNGEVYYWSKSARQSNEDGTLASQPNEALNFYNKYLAPYLKVMPTKSDTGVHILLADGSKVTMSIGYCMDMHFDYNGKKAPNKLGYDMFTFLLCTEEGINQGLYRKRDIPFDAYVPAQCNFGRTCSRDVLLQSCKNDAVTCSALIMYDDWQIKDDYPYKI